MEEVPVLKLLNDYREAQHQQGRLVDFSVLDEADFTEAAKVFTANTDLTDTDIRDAYLQLHLIQELGGSHAPIASVRPVVLQNKGKNFGKYDIVFIEAPEAEQIVRDTRSREHTAQAFLEGWTLRPTITNQSHLDDTLAAMQRFVSTGSQDQIANSGFRTKKKRGNDEFNIALTQNMNDRSGGYDRLTRDYTVGQDQEFGHDVPVEAGGADQSWNGRMQAKGANRAAREMLGIRGALRVLGPTYQKNKKNMSDKERDSYQDYLNVDRMAGDLFL